MNYLKIYFIVFSSIIAVGCSDIESNVPSFHVNDRIYFPSPSFACLTGELFNAAIEHAAAGEREKFAKMFSRFDCVEIPTSNDYKIISTDTAVKHFGIEITEASNSLKSGMFTSSEFAKFSSQRK